LFEKETMVGNSKLSGSIRAMAPQDLLRYAQRRWPLEMWSRARRKVMLCLASAAWRVCEKCAARGLVIKACDYVARKAWRVVDPWSEYPGLDDRAPARAAQRLYDRMELAYASMTAEERNALVRRKVLLNEEIRESVTGLENGNVYR
jgi:hypothetical protein